MYAKNFQESLKAVEAARAANIAWEPARMTADEKDRLLAAYHPDYKKSEFATLRIGSEQGRAGAARAGRDARGAQPHQGKRCRPERRAL